MIWYFYIIYCHAIPPRLNPAPVIPVLQVKICLPERQADLPEVHRRPTVWQSCTGRNQCKLTFCQRNSWVWTCWFLQQHTSLSSTKNELGFVLWLVVRSFGFLKNQTATETPAAVWMFWNFYAVWIVWYRWLQDSLPCLYFPQGEQHFCLFSLAIWWNLKHLKILSQQWPS